VSEMRLKTARLKQKECCLPASDPAEVFYLSNATSHASADLQ